jgi:hypothetical protein
MDVAIIVSSDSDLTEVARVVHDMTRAQGRVSVEVCRDEFDYRHDLDPNRVASFLRRLVPES